MTSSPSGGLGALPLALALSTLLLVLRLHLAHTVGFGDAEALYASYALHPQPAYLDHPGLVGLIARLLGHGSSPSPEAVHRFTAVAATLLPWAGLLAARGLGSSGPSAWRTLFALALAPELCVGLFALTPDLPLAYAWIGALGLAGLALRSEPGSWRALTALLGTGACVGLASLSKASGPLLGAALLATFLTTDPGRRHLRTVWPWLAFVLAGVLISPVVRWELQNGWPMLRHRLVATQSDAGLSLRNLGATLGGQLLYVTPPFLIAGAVLVRDLARRPHDALDRLLWQATWIPGLPLVALCLWSRVAEPHWLAPAYLGLTLHASRVRLLSPRLVRVCAATGLAIAGLGWAWVGTPLPPALAGSTYEPRYDLSNDYYAWKTAAPVLRGAVVAAERPGSGPVVVVGPHYIVCAQVHATLRHRALVGCRTPHGDDFDRWTPRPRWHASPTILFVSDDRFDDRLAKEFPKRKVVAHLSTDVWRGSRVVRRITVTRLDRDRAVAAAREPAHPRSVTRQPSARPRAEGRRSRAARGLRPAPDSAWSAADRRRRYCSRRRTGTEAALRGTDPYARR